MRKRLLSTHRCTSRQRGSLPSMCEDACPCAYSHSEQQSCCMVNQLSFFCRVTYPSPVFYSAVHTFLLSSPQMIRLAKQKREKRATREKRSQKAQEAGVSQLSSHTVHTSAFPWASLQLCHTHAPLRAHICLVCVCVCV